MAEFVDPGDDFTFEDFQEIPDGELREFLRGVDLSELSLALKVCSPALREKFLSNLSEKAALTVNEQMGFLGPLSRSDVEEAQQEIVNDYRRLDEEDEEEE